ncbi:TonB-dependent receptor [Stakelama marina]|nr:TonB-dependent receptor [Stakelama marina]
MKPAKGRMVQLAAALMVGTAVSAIAVAPAHAQQAQASLRGTVTDGGQPGGASQITAIEVNTGYRRTSPVMADGTYIFASLPPGTYRLEVQTPNGVRNTDQFKLAVAQNAQLDFDLQPTGSTAASGAATGETTGGEQAAATGSGNEIIVTGSRIQNLEGGEVGATISTRLIQTLPQNSRNFLSFADLAPGVQVNTGSNGNVSIQGGAQDSRTVNVFIDGVGQKDYVLKNGITGQDSSQGNPFPQSAIGEYRVISSNYKAEFDQVSSVAITAVTKSGTNKFHGGAFVDFTNQDLRAKTPLEKANGDDKTKTRDFQFGASLGGPIIKDVMHFFVTYEGKRQQIPTDVIPGFGLSPSDLPTQYQDNFGSFSRTFNEDLYFGKIDFSPTDRDLFEISAKVRREVGEDGFGGTNARSRLTDINNNETRLLFHYQRTNDNWTNDFKATYEYSAWKPTPHVFENGYVFQSADNQTILAVGGSGNYQDKGQKGWGVQDDFTYTGLARHAIKMGVKAKWVTLNALQQNNLNAQYYYDTQYPAGGFNDSVPYRVTFGVPVQGVGNGAIKSKNFQLGMYIQDDWQMTDRLTLNLGVRWDYEETPSYLNFVTPQDAVDAVSQANYPNLYQGNATYNINDYISNGHNRHPFKGAFQPRLGFSYDFGGKYDLTAFGGYGRSFDRNQFDFIQLEATAGSFRTLTFNFDTGDPNHSCTGANCIPWDPAYLTQAGRDQLATSTTGGGRELRFNNNDLKMPYSDQFSIGLRGRVGLIRPEIGFTHIASHDGFAFLLGNRRTNGAFFAPGEIWGPPWGFAPSGYGSIILGTNGVETRSDSAYLKLTKDYTRSSPWSLNFTYTYTDATENRQFGQVYALDYPNLDYYSWLPSAGVVKHRIVAAASADIPWGFTLSTKIQLRSPPYISYVTGTDNTNRHFNTVEADNKRSFILGDLWAYRQVDLAVSKSIPLGFLYNGAAIQFRADVLNVFNTANYTSYGTNTNNADTFRQISNLSIGGNPPRTFKLSASLKF